MTIWEAKQKGYNCNDCAFSALNCRNHVICCQDNSGLCDLFREIPAEEKALKEPERKNGNWLLELGTYLGGHPRYIYHCSVCGNVEEHAYADSKCANFCPNCGADMRGKKSDIEK